MARTYGDRWETVRSLVPGGQAETYLVRDLRDGPASEPKHVLKRLRNPERHERFRREVELLRELEHPGITRIVDHDLDNDPHYLVTTFCSRGSLAQQPERWKGNAIRALEFILQLSETLSRVHNKGVTHRDIKPANILLADDGDTPVIADFGIAYVSRGERMTLTDEAAGARLFIAPELEGGRSELVGPSTDIYSIGKLLYWLVAGGRTFPRERHRDPLYDLAKVFDGNPGLEHINQLLDKLVTEDPAERPPDLANAVAEMRSVLQELRRNSRVLAPNVQQACAFCRAGTYKVIRVTNGHDVRNFGFQLVGDAKWSILVCDRCGNVQLFRMDHVKSPYWWGSAGTEAPVRGG